MSVAKRRREERERARPTRRIVWAAGVLALVALSAGGVIAARERAGSAEAVPLRAADPAPALRGVDPVTGRDVDLASFRGKPVVVNVWASWCPGCAAEAADLAAFARAHPDAQVLGIDYQDSAGGASEFYLRYRWRHPSIFDPDGRLAAKLGLQGLPTTVFLDRRHEIVARITGATDRAGFENGLRRAVGGR